MKKIKDSVKTEMKKAVQKELSKMMAKQIAKEDSFKRMAQEMMSNFFEEDAIKEIAMPQPEESWRNSTNPWTKSTTDRLQFLAGIKKGDLKEEFAKLIDKNLYSEEKDYFNIKNVSDLNRFIKKANSNVLLTDTQMSTLFDPARIAEKTKSGTTIPNDIIFTQANPVNMSKLSSIVKEQAEADYSSINYSQEIKDKLFNYINSNKSSLEARHEQIHINSANNTKERYYIANKEDLYVDKNKIDYRLHMQAYNINPEHFSFNLEIETNTKTNKKAMLLKDIYLKGESFPYGNITSDDGVKLLDIAQQIYSDTIIKPLSETQPVKVAKTKVSRRKRIVSPYKREEIFENKKKSYKKVK